MYLADTEVMSPHLSRGQDDSYFKRLTKLTPSFELLAASGAERQIAETCIRDKFDESFGADVQQFLRYLLTMHCPSGVSGVSGISLAAQETLFLEQYLEMPIEDELAKVLGEEVNRNSIVEVGNLVAATRGASLALFIVLASSLTRAGHNHMVFTATASLRKKFDKLGFKTTFISEADPSLLSLAATDSWGNYYDSQPQVLVGSLDDAMRVIKGRSLFRCLQNVFNKYTEALANDIATIASR